MLLMTGLIRMSHLYSRRLRLTREEEAVSVTGINAG